MYDATIGRFFSADPIGLESGDANFYRYAGNDPPNAIDPSGLEVKYVYWGPEGRPSQNAGYQSGFRCYQQPKSNSNASCNPSTANGSPSTSGGDQLWAEFSALLGQFDPKASDRYNKEWFLGLSREEQLAYIKYLKDWNDYSKKEAARAEERAARDRGPNIGKADRDSPYCSFNDRWAGKKINSEADAFLYRRDWLWANGQSDIAQMELAELVLLSLGTPGRYSPKITPCRIIPRGNPLTCPDPGQKQKPKICDPPPKIPDPPKISREAPSTALGGPSWGFWDSLPKVSRGGRTYANINGRLYSQHAIERMTPRGFGTAAGGCAGRGVPPSVVEDVIQNGVINGIRVQGSTTRVSKILNGVEVVLENGIVITVITK